MKTVAGQDTQLLDYRKIQPLQDTKEGSLKDLSKDNYQKLLNSFQKHGFFVPIFVWQHDDKHYCLDGHARLRALNEEQIEFENTGFEVPVVYIEADTIQDAKEKLLKITSQYQRISQEGLDAFIAEAELPEVEVYKAVSFDALPFLGVNIEDEKDDESKAESKAKMVECPECGHEFVP